MAALGLSIALTGLDESAERSFTNRGVSTARGCWSEDGPHATATIANHTITKPLATSLSIRISFIPYRVECQNSGPRPIVVAQERIEQFLAKFALFFLDLG